MTLGGAQRLRWFGREMCLLEDTGFTESRTLILIHVLGNLLAAEARAKRLKSGFMNYTTNSGPFPVKFHQIFQPEPNTGPRVNDIIIDGRNFS